MLSKTVKPSILNYSHHPIQNVIRSFSATKSKTIKTYDHYPFKHPANLKNYTDREFHDYHKKLYFTAFGEPMPSDHLQNPNFTVFEINNNKRLLWKCFYKFYLLAAGLFCSGVGLFFYNIYLNTRIFQDLEKVQWIQAQFLEKLARFKNQDDLEEYFLFKLRNGYEFNKIEAELLFDNNYVGERPYFYQDCGLGDIYFDWFLIPNFVEERLFAPRMVAAETLRKRQNRKKI